MSRMQHKVNFEVKYNFRVLFLLDWLLNQGYRTQSAQLFPIAGEEEGMDLCLLEFSVIISELFISFSLKQSYRFILNKQLIWFNGTSTLDIYLMPDPIYTYMILNWIVCE